MSNGETTSWRDELLRVVIRQGPSGIVLAAILYLIYHFGSWAVTTGVPAHLQQIQAGYIAIQDKQDENLARLIESNNTGHALVVEALTEMRIASKEVSETAEAMKMMVEQNRAVITSHE